MSGKIIIDSPKISYRDIYFRMWACRDFEISHVWQRAIFLTAFLIACFAGYGGLVLSVITPGKSILSFAHANGIAFAITIVGMVVSLLWVMMAKGSKMWYENYEKAIDAFRNSSKIKSDSFDPGVNDIAGMKLSDIEGFKYPEMSDWVWSTKGGNFSVSRINIFIGQFSCLIWGVLMFVHVALAKCGGRRISDLRCLELALTHWAIMVIIVVLSLLIFWLYSNQSMKGSCK